MSCPWIEIEMSSERNGEIWALSKNILVTQHSIYTKICVSYNKQFSSGGRLNKKDGLTRYGDSHVKDKTS